MNTRLVAVLFVGVLLTSGLIITPVGGDSTDAAVGTASVDKALADTSGEQTVIVRLNEPTDRTLRSATGNNRVGAMQAHAVESRSPFERFADGNPHVEIDREFWLTNALVVTVDTDRVPLERLGTVENVERIHENHRMRVASTTIGGPSTDSSPSVDPSGPENTTAVPQPSLTTTSTTRSSTAPEFARALELINVPQVFEDGNRGGGIRVAVLDTGVNPDHPDIEISDDNWICYADCYTVGPHDVDGHGTHVSGTVGGGDANDAGLQIGVAPNATLMHAKVLNDDGLGNFANVVAGMQWAVDNDADVISMSLGSKGYNSSLIEPIRNAQASGTVVVAAAGNSGSGTSSSPGNVYDATAVGAVEVESAYPRKGTFGRTDDTVWHYSGGERIYTSEWTFAPYDWPDSYVVPDVTAPGSVIWSADTDRTTATCGNIPTTDLTCLEGTSMATPHVAGTVALMLSSSAVDRSPHEIHTALESTAVDIGEGETRQGAGRIDAAAAVAAVETRSNLTVTNISTPDRVTAGRTLTASYTVENVGNEAGSGQIQFSVNGTVIRTSEIGPLGPGDRQSGTFDHRTTLADQNSLAVSIATSSTARSRTVDLGSPEVQLTDVSLSPETVGKTEPTTHTLDFRVLNVSDDGQSDVITLSLPKAVSLQRIENATSIDAKRQPVTADAKAVSETEITYTMNPDTDAELRDVNVTIEFTARGI